MNSVVKKNSKSAVDILAGDDLDDEFLVLIRAGAQFGDHAGG